MLVLWIIAIVSVWILFQVLAELGARWFEKLYEKHLQKEQEKLYGTRKTKELDSSGYRHKN